MDTALKQILDRFTTELQGWLDQPSEASGKIDALRSQIEALKGELGADGLSDAIKALGTADKSAQRGKQRQASEGIAAVCKPLGINLEAKAPPKRKPRAPKTAKPSGG